MLTIVETQVLESGISYDYSLSNKKLGRYTAGVARPSKMADPLTV